CSMAADSGSIFEEGVLIPPVRICRRGAIVEEVFSIVCHNSRMRFERDGDIRAQISANHVGIRRLQEIAAELGRDEFIRYSDALLDYSYKRAIALLEALPNGTWQAIDYLDGDGVGSGPVP